MPARAEAVILQDPADRVREPARNVGVAALEREIGRDQHVRSRAAGFDGGAGRRRERAAGGPARDTDPGRAGAHGQGLDSFDGDLLGDGVRAAVDAGDHAVLVVGRPRRPVAVADEGELAADVDQPDAGRRSGLDAHEQAVIGRRDPDRPASDGDAGPAAGLDRDPLGDAVRGRVDPRQVVIRRVEKPDAFGARGERAHLRLDGNLRHDPRAPRIDAVDAVVDADRPHRPGSDRQPREPRARCWLRRRSACATARRCP